MPHFVRDFKQNEGWIRGVDGRLELSEEQRQFAEHLNPFRSLNERVHGRIKSKFRMLQHWVCDREISVLELPKPEEVVYAWTVCCLLHNIDIQSSPMSVEGFRDISCDAHLWGWPLYDSRLVIDDL